MVGAIKTIVLIILRQNSMTLLHPWYSVPMHLTSTNHAQKVGKIVTAKGYASIYNNHVRLRKHSVHVVQLPEVENIAHISSALLASLGGLQCFGTAEARVSALLIPEDV